ncbi:MAG: sulfite exporter TauE/SafE family protein [Saprospiraceae bacterium]
MLYNLLLLTGGLIAGIINTLAGNGSVITLSLCTEVIGLSPSIANGTNRLGILTQSIAGTASLYSHKKLLLKGTYTSIIVVFSGALIGIWLATILHDQTINRMYPWFLVFIFIVLLLKPERWLKTIPVQDFTPPWYIWPIYFLIGVYGGLIQIGIGIFYLATSIMINRIPWLHANAAKIVVTGLFTTIALIIFGTHGLVHLHTAIFLAIGQTIGAWMGVKYLSKNTGEQTISYYLLLMITGATIIKQFLF